MVFSRVKQLQDGVDKKIAIAMIMAKIGTNKDFKLAHADWVRDAAQNRYTQLKTQVKENVEKHQAIVKARRDKLAGI